MHGFPIISLHYMAKLKGFCICSEGPKSFDFEIIEKEIIPDGPALIRQSPFQKGLGPGELMAGLSV